MGDWVTVELSLPLVVNHRDWLYWLIVHFVSVLTLRIVNSNSFWV